MNIICTMCPNGCEIEVNENKNTVGAMCSRGERFAISEFENPTIMLTTTVKTSFSALPVLPVKTDKCVPKDKLNDVMKIVDTIIVTTPLKVGEVVYENIYDDINLISTMDMTRRIK